MDYGKKQEYAKNGEKAYYYSKNHAAGQGRKKDLPGFDEIFDLPLTKGILSCSIIHNGIIYFSSLDSYVYAVDADSGKRVWKFKTGAPCMSTPLVHRNHIYFGSNDGYFYSLDINGRMVWKKNSGDTIVSSPVAVGDKIIIGNGKGRILCFFPEGDMAWEVLAGGGIAYIPSVANGLIFAGSYDKRVYAIDLNGEIKWTFRTGERVSSDLVVSPEGIVSSIHNRSWKKTPEIEHAVVCCGSYDNYIYALDLEGHEKWKFNCGSSVLRTISDCENIYAGTFSGIFHAIDISGKSIWSFRTGGMAGGGAANEYVYFTSFDQKLHCVSKTGEKLWDFLTGGPIASWPLIANKRLYFGSTDAFFYCLDTKKRSVEWAFGTGFGLSPAIREKIREISNILVEHDKKIFKVWRPETVASSNKGASSRYNIPSSFSFAGNMAYGTSGPYKMESKYRHRKGYGS